MTLADLLKDYFNTDSDAASDAMSSGSLWGYNHWKTGEYVASPFESFANANGINKPELVDNYGGEDMGSDYYAVHKFTRSDESVYIKFWGWYASYDGAEYQDFSVVTPKEKMVVVYD